MLSPQTPVRSLLKLRPMAILVLDKRNIRFWDSLDQPLDTVVHRESLNDFLDEISFVQNPAPDTDWSAMPMYVLVEYLTQTHRNLLLQDVADMAHILDIHTLADSEEADGLRNIHRAFQDFVKEFQSHLEEEETYLFPKILRYEACLRDNRVHPEFHKGSIQSYLAMRLAQESRSIFRALDDLIDTTHRHAEEFQASFASRELLELALGFRDKLKEHAELETKALFPVARELEKNLYNLSIGGDPAVTFHRRGPMDSGILRLEE